MTKVDLEARRRTAVRLVRGGMSYRKAAKAVGAAPSSVCDWVNAYAQAGNPGLNPKPEGPRMKSALDDRQRAQLAKWLRQSPRKHGFATELWTLSRIRALIAERFGPEYSIGHVHRIVRRMGFTSQKPEARAREQNPEAVKHFRRTRWPEIKKARGTRAGR